MGSQSVPGVPIIYDVDHIQQCEALKATLDAYRPLDPHTLGELRRYYRVGLTYTSNALEGSTLTESETKVVLEDGITIGGKPMQDHLDALGHAKAYDFLFDLLDRPAVTESDLLRLHALVTEGTEASQPGRYRTKPVIITGSTYLPPQPQDVPKRMQAFLNEQLPQWRADEHPVHTAALAHLALVNIHPFMDGNGRTARLLMNLLLLQAGYPITLIPPILRQEYIACLDIAHTQGKREPFLNFIAAAVAESAKDLRRLLQHLRPGP
ncbi:MAG: Fic family protein [Candidatus Melainabacteria bacterium]